MIELKNRNVLILGFGRQGQALARWLPKQGAFVTVNDNRNELELGINKSDYPRTRFILERHPDSILQTMDLVCVSGGFPLDHPMVEAAKNRGVPITNDAQLFLERCPAPVIGITGSAGKTTTTKLVGEIVKNAGYRTWVGGNIGNVLLDDLDAIEKQDVVVMELSSFQLEIMESSPQVAAVLNITPNHLDRHGTMEKYVEAKSRILQFQKPGDIAVLSADDPLASTLEIIVQGEIVNFSNRKMVPNGTFMMGKRLMLAGAASFDYAPHVLCEREEIPLRGEHNLLNVLAACAIAGSLGLAADLPGIPPEVMHDTIINFQPVPHRLETVAEINGVTYVNDSIATAPERTMAALRSFDENLVLLLGGADKDLPWKEVAYLALQKVRHIILFGQPGEKQVVNKAEKALKNLGADQTIITKVVALETAIEKAAKIAQAGDVVLLSPGGTSYDAYKDYAERGEHFRRLVKRLAEQGSL